MKFYYDMSVNKPSTRNAELLKVERNVMNPIDFGGITFVSIAYYKLPTGETIGIVW